MTAWVAASASTIFVVVAVVVDVFVLVELSSIPETAISGRMDGGNGHDLLKYRDA